MHTVGIIIFLRQTGELVLFEQLTRYFLPQIGIRHGTPLAKIEEVVSPNRHSPQLSFVGAFELLRDSINISHNDPLPGTESVDGPARRN